MEFDQVLEGDGFRLRSITAVFIGGVPDLERWGLRTVAQPFREKPFGNNLFLSKFYNVIK
jgi:hypothetical protein